MRNEEPIPLFHSAFPTPHSPKVSRHMAAKTVAPALPNVPAWLTARAGTLTPGIAPHVVFVNLGGKPEYKLEGRPAKGKFTCVVTATVNGRPIDAPAEALDSPAAAFDNGLARLQAKLGW